MSGQSFLDKFFQAIIDKREEDIRLSYWPGDETYVILEGPRLATLGFAKISEGWIDFCRSKIFLDRVEWLEGPMEFPFEGSVTLAGVIRLVGGIDGGEPFDKTFRATFLLRDSVWGWKILHEHVSGALTDPYGIGDWKRQNA